MLFMGLHSFVQQSIATNLYMVLPKTLGICLVTDSCQLGPCFKNHATNAVSIMYTYSMLLVVFLISLLIVVKKALYMCTQQSKQTMTFNQQQQSNFRPHRLAESCSECSIRKCTTRTNGLYVPEMIVLK